MDVPEPFHNRYTNLRLVGRGGFGVVYRAWDMEMEREVALKLLNADLAADPEWRKRFRQEATAASKLNHPNITIVFDRGEFRDQLYIVMEYVEGDTLSKIIERRLPLADHERLLLLEQLCAGLHYAHQRNIIHRDIKPVNLVVHEERDGGRRTRTLKILDFGIAKLIDTAQTATGAQLMFTPNYVSPEVIQGRHVDHRCDIFAVGSVAYELLTFEKTFQLAPSTHLFEFIEEIRRKVVDQPHSPMCAARPDIDPELSAIVDRALAKDPDDRYQDLGEMGRHLRRVRERIEASQPEASSATTVALDPALVAAVTAARHALETGDPDAAVIQLEAALNAPLTVRSRRFVEQSLEHARERQTTKRAREATANATAEFQRGGHASAIALLEQFEPGHLVASRLAQFHEAALLIEKAEQAVADGPAAVRAASLFQLDRFTPPELTRAAAQRLRAAATEKFAEEERARERDALPMEQELMERARAQFRSGQREDAIASLSGVREPGPIMSARQQMRAANALVQRATGAVDHGSRSERERSLQALTEFPDRDLVEDVLERLQHEAAAREADERREEEEAARVRADRAVQWARAEFRRGNRASALDALARFDDPGHVADALARLRDAERAIETAHAALESGTRPARAEAIARLASYPDPELVAGALGELRSLEKRQTSAPEEAPRGTAHGRATPRSHKRLVATAIAAAALLLALVAFWSDVTPVSRDRLPAPPPAPTGRPAPTILPSARPDAAGAVTSASPNAPPTVTPGPSSPEVEQGVQLIRDRARRQLLAGQLEQALSTIERGLVFKPDDAELRTLLVEMAERASVDAARARRDAIAAGAPKEAASIFETGLRQERRAEGDRQGGRLPSASRQFWAARDAFLRAVEDTVRVVEATPVPQPSVLEPQRTEPAAIPPPPTGAPAPAPIEAPVKGGSDMSKTAAPAPPDDPSRHHAREDEVAIRGTLRAYEAAFEAMDVAALQRVQVLSPQQVRILQEAFAQARAYERKVAVSRVTLSPDGLQASVVAIVNQAFTPRAGERQTMTVPTTFLLEKRAGSWIIVSTKTS